MYFYEGLKKVWKDGVLRLNLIIMFTAFGFVNVMLLPELNMKLTAVIVMGAVFYVMFYFMITSLFSDTSKWSKRKHIMVFSLLLPFAFLIMLGMFILGFPAAIFDMIVSAVFSHLFCLGIGLGLQKKIEQKVGGNVPYTIAGTAAAVLLIFVGIGSLKAALFMIRGLLPQFADPDSAVLVWIPAVPGLIIGLLKKRPPLAFGIYVIIASVYLDYLFMKFFMDYYGLSGHTVSLVTLPYNIFILLYSVGVVVRRFVGDREIAGKSAIRTAVIFLFFTKLYVNAFILIEPGDVDPGTFKTIFDFVNFVLFFIFFGIFLFYSSITAARKRYDKREISESESSPN